MGLPPTNVNPIRRPAICAGVASPDNTDCIAPRDLFSVEDVARHNRAQSLSPSPKRAFHRFPVSQ